MCLTLREAHSLGASLGSYIAVMQPLTACLPRVGHIAPSPKLRGQKPF